MTCALALLPAMLRHTAASKAAQAKLSVAAAIARCALSAATCLVPLVGQQSPGTQPLGATFRTEASTASRGGLVSAPGVLAARFDHDDLVGFCRTTRTPNRRAIHGFRFEGEDKNGATPETYSIRVYTEDPARPGFPALPPLLMLGPFQTTATAPGVQRQTYTHQLLTPLEVPADADLFVGIAVAAAPSWPNDGFAVQCVLGGPSNWPIYDAPGAAPIQHGSYGLAIDAAGQAFYNSTRQLLIDLLCEAPGGAGTALHNQTTYPIGTTMPGSGGFLSGLHPDAVAPPRRPGRLDRPGFAFLDNNLPNGAPVFFLTDFGSFGPETPVQSLVPGSVGVLCLKSPSVITVGVGLMQNGTAAFVLQLGTGVRSVLQGLPLLQQGIALAPNLSIRASPCIRQLF